MKKLKRKKRDLKDKEILSRSQAKYRFQEGHAEKARRRSNRTYRKSAGEFELTGRTVLKSLQFTEDYAEPLSCYSEITGGQDIFMCIRPTVLAKLLDTSYQTIWRWIAETNQLPEPVLITQGKGRSSGVFHVEEARVIIRAIGEHLTKFKYYRTDHHQVRDRVFNEIEKLRELNYGVEQDGDQPQRQSTEEKRGKHSRRKRR